MKYLVGIPSRSRVANDQSKKQKVLFLYSVYLSFNFGTFLLALGYLSFMAVLWETEFGEGCLSG